MHAFRCTDILAATYTGIKFAHQSSTHRASLHTQPPTAATDTEPGRNQPKLSSSAARASRVMGCGGSTPAEAAPPPEPEPVTQLDGCELVTTSNLAEGQYVILDGVPCIIVSSTIVPTKSQGEKRLLKAEDIFTGQQHGAMFLSAQQVNVPTVIRTVYTMEDADDEGGYMLVAPDGTKRDNMTYQDAAANVDKTKDVKLLISKALMAGQTPKLTVVKAMGQEKIVACDTDMNVAA